MQRRHWLSALASIGFLGLTHRVRADLLPGPPPPVLAVHPEPATFHGTPTDVLLVVTNPTAAPVEIQGLRLLITDAGIRFPLHVSRIEVDGRQTGVYDPFTVAPSASKRVRVVFDQVPPTALRGSSITFLLRMGGASECTFTLRRA